MGDLGAEAADRLRHSAFMGRLTELGWTDGRSVGSSFEYFSGGNEHPKARGASVV
jgi:hypothetical protein